MRSKKPLSRTSRQITRQLDKALTQVQIPKRPARGWMRAIREALDGRDWPTFPVNDTGIGMGPQDTQKIFDEFSTIDKSNSNKFGSTGLGLAISRRLCQMLMGDISVTSVLAAGSTFTVHLPADV